VWKAEQQSETSRALHDLAIEDLGLLGFRVSCSARYMIAEHGEVRDWPKPQTPNPSPSTLDGAEHEAV
jgi:hypothetical protein